MKQRKDHLRQRAHDGTQPLWFRMLALACLLLVGISSTAQATHIHGQYLPRAEKHASRPADASQTPTNEAGCLLCVAMHSALPVAATVPVPLALISERVAVPTAQDRIPDAPWHFAMFSRPPPAVETL